ncbi:MAG: hypothetical protein AUG44_27870 [Actinobacteria bacterium 13_1_20CM_3_71_11]|nr:MAG: hypothetical protein AUG44_27870 [Actinobacteria bacterium 13_1_20CM_3_71_11]TML32539.1 MAG: hypothetical protein E6G35_01890 [Actinomycetota bacterium]
MAKLGIPHRSRTADEADTQTTDSPTARHAQIDERRPVDRTVTDDPADERVVDRPVAEKTVVERPVPVEEPAPRWVRVSAFATLGLIVGLVALAATLTGLLAPVGVALGVVGGAISAGGLVGASRRGVTGHSVALLGLLASIAAIALGVLAIAGYLPWLDSRTDEVSRLRDWLDARLPWMKHW